MAVDGVEVVAVAGREGCARTVLMRVEVADIQFALGAALRHTLVSETEMRTDVVRVRIVGCAARDPADGKVCLVVRAHAAKAHAALVEYAALFLLLEEDAAADVVGIALAVRAVIEVGVVAAASVLDDGTEEDAVIAAHDLA